MSGHSDGPHPEIVEEALEEEVSDLDERARELAESLREQVDLLE